LTELSLCFPTLCFLFTATAAPQIYTLSLHDALPISCALTCWEPGTTSARTPAATRRPRTTLAALRKSSIRALVQEPRNTRIEDRSEEHTSELQSLAYLVCRLLLEKKKKDKWREQLKD